MTRLLATLLGLTLAAGAAYAEPPASVPLTRDARCVDDGADSRIKGVWIPYAGSWSIVHHDRLRVANVANELRTACDARLQECEADIADAATARRDWRALKVAGVIGAVAVALAFVAGAVAL